MKSTQSIKQLSTWRLISTLARPASKTLPHIGHLAPPFLSTSSPLVLCWANNAMMLLCLDLLGDRPDVDVGDVMCTLLLPALGSCFALPLLPLLLLDVSPPLASDADDIVESDVDWRFLKKCWMVMGGVVALWRHFGSTGDTGSSVMALGAGALGDGQLAFCVVGDTTRPCWLRLRVCNHAMIHKI